MKDLLKRVTQGGEAAFPKDEFDRRVKALKKLLAANDIDLYLTSGAENIFYLCGQQTPGYYTFQCLAVPVRGRPFLVLRGLEAFNARANTWLSSIVGYADDANPAEAVAEVVVARGYKGKRIAVDRNAWFLTVNLYERLKRKLGRSADGSGLVERLRRVKSERELAAMVRAGRINDAGMAAGLAAVRRGANENDVAAAIMQASIAAGSEYVGMEPFVSSGPRSGHPHSTWRRRRLRARDLVILETAGCYQRYHAALFRSVALGRVPARARSMYAVCREGLDAGLAEMKPGNTCAAVHHAVQAVIDAHGETAGYRKRSGYSLGISFAPDWGEGNILSLYRGVDVPLEPGMVFHMPITLRDYARFTVAVSESVVVTARGHKTLSRIPRDLVEA
jgi:Xaa-Pro dipeptidase